MAIRLCFFQTLDAWNLQQAPVHANAATAWWLFPIVRPLLLEMQNAPDHLNIVAVRGLLPLAPRLQELLNCRDVADSCFKCLE